MTEGVGRRFLAFTEGRSRSSRQAFVQASGARSGLAGGGTASCGCVQAASESVTVRTSADVRRYSHEPFGGRGRTGRLSVTVG
jgi:hypothetical protein